MPRPISVTVAAWVIIALAIEGIAGSLSSPLQSTVLAQLADPQLGVSASVRIGVLVQLGFTGCAVFMLRGAAWSRVAYVVITAFVLLGVMIMWSRSANVASLAVYAALKAGVLVYVLFRPEANAYFAAPGPAAGVVP